MFVVASALFVLSVPGISALDYKGRTDTGYQLDFGDNALVNRAYNYESLDVGIAKGWSLYIYGGLLSAIGDHVNSSDASGSAEASDNALRNLLDALNGNPGTWVSYSLYKVQVSYSTPLFGLSLGRSAGQSGSATPFDGLSFWFAPTDSIRIEAFGGHPWLDANVARFADLPDQLSAGEYEVGGQASASFMDGALSAGLGYVMLSQSSYATGTLGSTTSVVSSGLGNASLGWSPSQQFGAGAAASFVDLGLLDISAWAEGNLETLRMGYSLKGAYQPVDAAAVANAFDAFSSVLGSSKAYVNGSLDLSEDITGFLPAPSFLKAAQLEVGCDYRQPLGNADAWNPQYLQLRVGPMVAIDGGLSVSLYYNYLLTLSSDDSLNAFSGEIREKLSSFDIRLGTAFDANKFESSPTSNTVLETIDTQEYYLKVKWQATKAFDLSLKANYSSSLYGSTTAPALTDSTLLPTNTVVTTQLDGQARTAIRLELRAGFRF